MSGPQPELELVETDALVEELRKRFKAVVILVLRPDEQDKPVSEMRCLYYGGLIEAMGLVRYAEIYLQQICIDPQYDAEREE